MASRTNLVKYALEELRQDEADRQLRNFEVRYAAIKNLSMSIFQNEFMEDGEGEKLLSELSSLGSDIILSEYFDTNIHSYSALNEIVEDLFQSIVMQMANQGMRLEAKCELQRLSA